MAMVIAATGGAATAAPPLAPPMPMPDSLQQRALQTVDGQRDRRQQREWQQLADGAVTGPHLNLNLGAGTRLVYQLPRRDLAPSVDPGSDPKASLGLQFQASRRDGDPRSLLMVQVSGASSLQFRPRSGGIAVTYRSTF